MSTPENPHYHAAMMAYKADRFEEAIVLFGKALAAVPNDADIYHDRGVCHYHMDKKKEALADMEKSLELEPENGYRYASRAYMRGHLKDLHGAIEDYKKAIEIDPEDAISHNNLGMIEEQLGYKEKAMRRFKLADELSSLLEDTGVTTEDAPAPVFEGEPVNIQKEIDIAKNDPKPSRVRVLLDVFKNKETRREFWQFIKGGLKG